MGISGLNEDVFMLLPQLVVIGVWLVYYVSFAGAAVLMYVLSARGLQTAARRRGLKNPWLAWIPVANSYLLGSLSDQYQYVTRGRIRNRRKVLLWLEIAAAILLIVFMAFYTAMTVYAFDEMTQPTHQGMIEWSLILMGVGVLMEGVVVTRSVFSYTALYDYYRSSLPNKRVAYLVLSIVFSFLAPVFIFKCRNEERGMPARKPNQ